PDTDRAGLAPLRQCLRLVVAGNIRAAIENLGIAFCNLAVKMQELRVEITARFWSRARNDGSDPRPARGWRCPRPRLGPRLSGCSGSRSQFAGRSMGLAASRARRARAIKQKVVTRRLRDNRSGLYARNPRPERQQSGLPAGK